MRPLLVAITGSGRTVLGISSRLKEQLLRRGFQVQLLQNSGGHRFDGECDIILFPCRFKAVDQLAEQIEQGWTREWLSWYTSQRERGKKSRV